MLNLFLPIMKITESTEPNKVQYFNFQTMKYSNNGQILELLDNIKFINLLIWTTIIIGLISFIGLIISISEKYKKIGNSILLVCCSIIIFSVSTLILFFLFVKKVIDANNISLANIFDPISYCHIQIVLLIFLAICSTGYFLVIINSYLKKAKEKKNSNKEQQTKDLLDDDQKYGDKEKTIHWMIDEKEKPDKLENEKESKDEEIELEAETIKEELNGEQPKTRFIEKQGSELLKKEATNNEIPKPQAKLLEIRCPQCKNIFSAEKHEGATKTKCPHCGKEGIIK
jgi:ribosomal protein S27E